MLELDGLTRRFGDVVALDDLSFTVAPAGCSASSARTGPGRRPRCGSCSACSSPTRARCAGSGRPIDAATRARFGYMPEERGLYPKMRVRDQLVYFARLHGMRGRRGAARPPTAGSSGSGSAERAADKRGDALARQPAARPARRRARPRPRGARARRAVLRPRPDRRRRDERRAAGARGRGRAGRVLLATSSSSSSGCARTWRSSTAAGSWRPARSTELRERGRGDVEQVRVRVEGDGDGGWVAGVPGAEVAGAGAARRARPARPGGDPDAVLDAARAAGTVTHFSLERPSLADLFRAAVAA